MCKWQGVSLWSNFFFAAFVILKVSFFIHKDKGFLRNDKTKVPQRPLSILGKKDIKRCLFV